MQAIQTKYLPATYFLGSRIKAWCDRGSLTVSYPYELSGDEVHRFAVAKLVRKFADEDAKQYGSKDAENPWLRPFVTGGLPDKTMAHVFTL